MQVYLAYFNWVSLSNGNITVSEETMLLNQVSNPVQYKRWPVGKLVYSLQG